MTITTITSIILAAVASIFAVLFILARKEAEQDKEESIKDKRTINELKDNLTAMRIDQARLEAKSGFMVEPLNRDSLAEFLRKEKSNDVKVLDDSDYVTFRYDDDIYFFNCSQLPRFLGLGIRNRYDADSGYHIDIMERAAMHVNDSIHMVKATVVENDYFGFHVITTDRTVGTMRENFDIYMSIMDDARRLFGRRYWEIMEEEHPDECSKRDDDEASHGRPATVEDLAMKMAGATGDPKLMS